jgi:hypothetical protein
VKGAGFWVAAIAFVIIAIWWHTGTDYFEPVADVYLTLDEHATEEHCFEGTRIACERERTGYRVRGGTLRARVTSISDLGNEAGVHRAAVSIQVNFDLDNRYQGWGWSRFDRPILYGWVQAASAAGEGTHRHVGEDGDITFLHALAPPTRSASRYAPGFDGSCSTDYRHDLCRFRTTLPITGATEYVRIHLRERFR